MADLVTFTEEILNGKHHFLCSVKSLFFYNQTANKRLVLLTIGCDCFFGNILQNCSKRREIVFRFVSLPITKKKSCLVQLSF